jgi:hypothetical protein
MPPNTTRSTKVPVALIDVDGVLYHFGDEMREIAAAHLHRPIDEFERQKVWNFYTDQWGMTETEFDDLVRVGIHQYGLFRYEDPIPGSLEGLEALAVIGVRVHLTSSIFYGEDTEDARASRLNWLSDQGIATDLVSFTADRAALATEHLSEGRVVYALTARPETFANLEKANAITYLLSQPWNIDVETPRRVATVPEFAEHVARSSIVI